MRASPAIIAAPASSAFVRNVEKYPISRTAHIGVSRSRLAAHGLFRNIAAAIAALRSGTASAGPVTTAMAFAANAIANANGEASEQRAGERIEKQEEERVPVVGRNERRREQRAPQHDRHQKPR
jgi:hypothetical protein